MRLRMTGAMLIMSAAILAGCGSSSSSSPSTSSSASSAAASSTASAASSASASATSSSASSTASGSSFASAGNCQGLINLAKKYEAQIASSLTGGSQFNLGAALSALKSLAAATPPAIHASAEYIVQLFSQFATLEQKLNLKPGTTPTASQISQIEAGAAQLDTPKYKAAATQITNWINANCKGATS